MKTLENVMSFKKIKTCMSVVFFLGVRYLKVMFIPPSISSLNEAAHCNIRDNIPKKSYYYTCS
jgi:hypothetical protein